MKLLISLSVIAICSLVWAVLIIKAHDNDIKK